MYVIIDRYNSGEIFGIYESKEGAQMAIVEHRLDKAIWKVEYASF